MELPAVVLPLASDSEDKPLPLLLPSKISESGQSKRIISRCIYQGKGKHNMQRHGFKNSWVSTALVNHKKHKSNSKLTECPMFRYLREGTTLQLLADTQGSAVGCSPGGTGRSDVPVNVPLDVSWFL